MVFLGHDPGSTRLGTIPSRKESSMFSRIEYHVPSPVLDRYFSVHVSYAMGYHRNGFFHDR